MARVNVMNKNTRVTHEGGRAAKISPLQELRRSVMACMLWEKGFYEDGEAIAERITKLVSKVKPEEASAIAIYVRNKANLRHAPMLIVRAMAKLPNHKKLVADTLYNIINRADELAEFLALYWKDDKEQPISAQVKRGLAQAFTKFNAYALAKYNRDNDIKLRDVLFMVHAKPKDEVQAEIWKKLVEGTLEAPDTWEVALSAGKDKRETWERLISEDKLGAMALLRNLRNMEDAEVPKDIIKKAIKSMKTEKILPFRFIAAASHAVALEPALESKLIERTQEMPKLKGETILLVDVSGSMFSNMSAKTTMEFADAACGIAMLARELCESVRVFTFSNYVVEVPARRGFALRDAIVKSMPHGGTYLGDSVSKMYNQKAGRLIVVTDEQSYDTVPPPPPGMKGYMINVAPYQNGVGYGEWTHIDGFSEATLEYIREYENMDNAPFFEEVDKPTSGKPYID